MARAARRSGACVSRSCRRPHPGVFRPGDVLCGLGARVRRLCRQRGGGVGGALLAVGELVARRRRALPDRERTSGTSTVRASAKSLFDLAAAGGGAGATDDPSGSLSEAALLASLSTASARRQEAQTRAAPSGHGRPRTRADRRRHRPVRSDWMVHGVVSGVAVDRRRIHRRTGCVCCSSAVRGSSRRPCLRPVPLSVAADTPSRRARAHSAGGDSVQLPGPPRRRRLRDGRLGSVSSR